MLKNISCSDQDVSCLDISRPPEFKSVSQPRIVPKHVSSSSTKCGSASVEGLQLLHRLRRWCADICGGKESNGCNKTFAVWKSFRKDCKGAIPVPFEALDTPAGDVTDNFPPLNDGPPPYGYAANRGTDYPLDPLEDCCSMETDGSSMNRGSPWCKILYWEGRDRKGTGFPVTSPAIDVLGDTPHGSGLSLAALFGGQHSDQRVMKTRKKICQGLVLWREEETVWVYNRSEAPIYLNSASLDGSFYHLNLYKCPPGYAMIIYYYEMARHLMRLPEYQSRCMDKADVNSVRISFAKGWGSNYQRREVLCCPCWLEVHVLRVDQTR